MKCKSLYLLALSATAYAAAPAQPPVFNVHSYGVNGNGKANDAAAINRAIDAASAAGGTCGINGSVDSGCVVGLAIAVDAIGVHVEDRWLGGRSRISRRTQS